MKKYIEFAEKVAAVKEAAMDLTVEQISALGVLDPEFKKNAELLYKVFGTMFEFEEYKKNSKEESAETAVPVVPVPEEKAVGTVTTKKTSTKKTTKKNTSSKKKYEPIDVPEGFFVHPEYINVCANKDGDIIVSNKKVTPRMTGGYIKVYIGNGKYANGARLVYECCTGKPIKDKICIKYKNDKHDDIRFENLSLTKHRGGYGSFSDADVVRISERVAYYATQDLSTTQLVENIVKDLSVSTTGVRSVLAGNYSKISGKYFYVGPGKKVIPIKQTNTTDIKKMNLIGDPCEVTLNFGIKMGMEAFDSKYLSGEKIEDRDLVVPITNYMYNEDGTMAPTATIKEKIKAEYGADIVPSDKLIMDVKEKKFGKGVVEAALRIK